MTGGNATFPAEDVVDADRSAERRCGNVRGSLFGNQFSVMHTHPRLPEVGVVDDEQ
jgi:hypothetical protein